jgi:hypothetical protein
MNFRTGFLGILAAILSSHAAYADQFKLPEEIGRIEAPRDTNVFQLEPTILNERYYTSGAAERRQFVGTTLAEGAAIPDSDYPVPVVVPGATVPVVAPNLVPASPRRVQTAPTNRPAPAQVRPQ